MRVGWLTPKATPQPAGPRGEGVYVVKPIEQGETVAAFGGFIVTAEQLTQLPDWQVSRSVQVDDELYLTSIQLDDPPDLINHSCEANLGVRGNILLVAMRDIGSGEELSFDYAMSDATPYDEFECFCETSSCRGRVRHTDWQLPEVQKRYAGYFSAHIQKRIDQQPSTIDSPISVQAGDEN